jgi:hypothetical protein
VVAHATDQLEAHPETGAAGRRGGQAKERMPLAKSAGVTREAV